MDMDEYTKTQDKGPAGTHFGKVEITNTKTGEKEVYEYGPDRDKGGEVFCVACEDHSGNPIRVLVSCTAGFLYGGIMAIFEEHPDVARKVTGDYIGRELVKGMATGKIGEHRGSRAKDADLDDMFGKLDIMKGRAN